MCRHCKSCILLLYATIVLTQAAPVKDSAAKATDQGLLITDKKDIIANIVLKDLLVQVEEEGKTLSFTYNQKAWVLQKLSKYLFGDEESEIINDVLQTPVRRGKHQKKHRNKSLYRTKRKATDNAMDKLSFSQEYRLLVRFSNLLRAEEQQNTRTSQHENLYFMMEAAG